MYMWPPLQENDASPLSFCLCPQAYWPKISQDNSTSPEPPAQDSD